jgi:hypothetical protein
VYDTPPSTHTSLHPSKHTPTHTPASASQEAKEPIVEEIINRRTGKKEHEYEVVWESVQQGKGVVLTRENTWHTRTELKVRACAVLYWCAVMLLCCCTVVLSFAHLCCCTAVATNLTLTHQQTSFTTLTNLTTLVTTLAGHGLREADQPQGRADRHGVHARTAQAHHGTHH